MHFLFVHALYYILASFRKTNVNVNVSLIICIFEQKEVYTVYFMCWKKDLFNKNDFRNKTQIFGIHFVYSLKLLNFAASVIYLMQSLQWQGLEFGFSFSWIFLLDKMKLKRHIFY